MGTGIKRQHSAEFKTNVALELLKGEETLSQVCSRYQIHPTQARRWKDKMVESIKLGFNGTAFSDQLKDKDRLIDELYQQIGKLKYQLDWLKKKMGYTE